MTQNSRSKRSNRWCDIKWRLYRWNIQVIRETVSVSMSCIVCCYILHHFLLGIGNLVMWSCARNKKQWCEYWPCVLFSSCRIQSYSYDTAELVKLYWKSLYKNKTCLQLQQTVHQYSDTVWMKEVSLYLLLADSFKNNNNKSNTGIEYFQIISEYVYPHLLYY